MPFTIDGQWIPKKEPEKTSSKPVKVRLQKRGNSVVTVVLNLNKSSKELAEIAAQAKRKLGCGGAVKDGVIEVQGDKVELVVALLKELGIKAGA
ncbi:MAG: translation initiation factor [Parachlamydiales bacterium]|jgi:translation initiation factor 1